MIKNNVKELVLKMVPVPEGIKINGILTSRADFFIQLLQRNGMDLPTLVEISCLCARQVLDINFKELIPSVMETIESAEKWASLPTEENKNKTLEIVKKSWQEFYEILKLKGNRNDENSPAIYAFYTAGTAARAVNGSEDYMDYYSIVNVPTFAAQAKYTSAPDANSYNDAEIRVHASMCNEILDFLKKKYSDNSESEKEK